MAIEEQTARTVFRGDGSTRAFPVTWYLDAEENVIVKMTNVTTAQVKTLELGTDYTVTPSDDEYPTNGAVINYPKNGVTPALGSDYRLTVIRNVPYTQSFVFPNNTRLLPQNIEGGLDGLELQIQQVNDKADNAVSIPAGMDYDNEEFVAELFDKAKLAEQSAQTATTKAQEAKSSATSASQSAINAKVSETNAKSSATSAGQSAQTATTKAQTATTKAQEAKSSATNASQSAQTATTKAQEAKSSATSASQSAQIATTKAQEAKSSATSASQSAQIATTKAQEAKSSATNAKSSATSAKESEDKAQEFAERAENASSSIGNPVSNVTVDNNIITVTKGVGGSAYYTVDNVDNAAHATTAGTADNATNADVSKKVNGTATNGSATDLVTGTMAINDYFRIRIGGSNDAGYAEIATADNGNEPIYIRQYEGSIGFSDPIRTATILDSSGNTSFPGTVTAPSFNGTATKATQDSDGNAINTTYLKRSGGTMGGALNLANNTLNLAGDNCYFGDQDIAGGFCLKGANGATNLTFIDKDNAKQKASLSYTGGNLISSATIQGNLRGTATNANNLAIIGSAGHIKYGGGDVDENTAISQNKVNLLIGSWYSTGFRDLSGSGTPIHVAINHRNGNIKTTGNVTANGAMYSATPGTSDNSTRVATTAFVKNQKYLQRKDTVNVQSLDFNSYTSDGMYNYGGAFTNSYSDGSVFGTLVVLNNLYNGGSGTSGTYISQTAHDANGDIYVRYRNGTDNWSAWRKFFKEPTRTVLMDTWIGNGDINLSESWRNFDELVFACTNDNRSELHFARLSTTDLANWLADSSYPSILSVDFVWTWTLKRNGTTDTLLKLNIEDSGIAKVIGIKY